MMLPSSPASFGGIRNRAAGYIAAVAVTATVAPVRKFSSFRRDKEGFSREKLSVVIHIYLIQFQWFLCLEINDGSPIILVIRNFYIE
jgi:hypothetical protein